jgi:hypothetical protein
MAENVDASFPGIRYNKNFLILKGRICLRRWRRPDLFRPNRTKVSGPGVGVLKLFMFVIYKWF